jgi:phenylalanyl-tRNA synthetase beta chain
VGEWVIGEAPGSPYHPGRSAVVLIGGERAGEVGELHPRVGERFDLEGRVAAFELRVDALLRGAHPEVQAEPPSRFPPVRRDVAFVVDREVRAGAVRALLREAAGDLLERVVLFDVFEGGSLPEGRKSLAYALDLRAPDRTLTDEEANEVVDRIAARLAEDLGAELRAG